MKTRWKYRAYALGVKKRGRKKDNHFSDVIGITDDLDLLLAESLAISWAIENMKTTEKLQVCASFWTYCEASLTEQWQPMNPEHNFRKTIEVKQNA